MRLWLWAEVPKIHCYTSAALIIITTTSRYVPLNRDRGVWEELLPVARNESRDVHHAPFHPADPLPSTWADQLQLPDLDIVITKRRDAGDHWSAEEDAPAA